MQRPFRQRHVAAVLVCSFWLILSPAAEPSSHAYARAQSVGSGPHIGANLIVVQLLYGSAVAPSTEYKTRFDVQNIGNEIATHVRLYIRVAEHLVFGSATPTSGTVSGPNEARLLTCDVGDLAPLQLASVWVYGTVDQAVGDGVAWRYLALSEVPDPDPLDNFLDTYQPIHDPPTIESVTVRSRNDGKFELEIQGTNFAAGLEVRIPNCTEAWRTKLFSATKIVVIGPQLQECFPRGTTVEVGVQNVDGLFATFSITR
jgi:hypothetical protein